jgi:hypothetical protein
MSDRSAADQEIAAIAHRLRQLKSELGTSYWDDPDARDLRNSLRTKIGLYGAWAEDKPPMHQRARIAARYEAELATLLWPGRGDN